MDKGDPNKYFGLSGWSGYSADFAVSGSEHVFGDGTAGALADVVRRDSVKRPAVAVAKASARRSMKKRRSA